MWDFLPLVYTNEFKLGRRYLTNEFKFKKLPSLQKKLLAQKPSFRSRKIKIISKLFFLFLSQSRPSMEALWYKHCENRIEIKITHLGTAVQNFTFLLVFVSKVANFRQPKVCHHIWTENFFIQNCDQFLIRKIFIYWSIFHSFFLSELIKQRILLLHSLKPDFGVFITKSLNCFLVVAVSYPWWILEGVMPVWVLWPEPPLFWCCSVW